jgi:membrane protease subunit (stomatin/prohibitin family)
MSLPWGFSSPLRAEVFFVNMKIFPNLKWGTRDPVAFRDSELGLIRLRAFGIFNIQVIQPVLFINSLVGTQGVYTTEEIEDYLNRVIVSRFNDYLGENIDTIFNLPGRYDELSEGLKKILVEDLSHFGLGLSNLYINSITPPTEAQKSIDDKSRMGVFDDMNKLLQMKTAMAMEKASETQGEAGAGMGMGLGFMMPAMFSGMMKDSPVTDKSPGPETQICPDCKNSIQKEAKFCPYCGHQQIIFKQCTNCNKNLPPNAKFCPRCGHRADEKPKPKKCSNCGTINLPDSIFCNQCGEKN